MEMASYDLLASTDKLIRTLCPDMYGPIGQEKALTFCGYQDRMTVGYARGSSNSAGFFSQPIEVI